MNSRMPGLLPALILGATLGLAAPSFAQTAPLTLPAPTEAVSDKAAPRPAKKAPVRKKKAVETDESGLAIPGAARSGKKRGEPTFSETSTARPKKFVPAEFDNGDDSDSGAARPIMTPSGRAGVGMRF